MTTISLLSTTANRSITAGTSAKADSRACFADRFGVALPRELREPAAALSWDGFVETYGHAPGPVRLRQWTCLGAGPATHRPGAQSRTYRATIAVGNRVDTCTAAAGGPLAALTTMLHEHGVPLEMLRFHQFCCDDRTATFIQGSDGRHAEWAMGYAHDPAQSARDAVICCANRLLSAA